MQGGNHILRRQILQAAWTHELQSPMMLQLYASL